ncbi:MAG: prepilin-type N-terminal cleavage/methylation domain-containing protein, partial [Phycisphaerae bacterium]|nr:prepilin-type N-terminal cleavage/methylation domain-containing protein [Phycisphaerae bacterium]
MQRTDEGNIAMRQRRSAFTLMEFVIAMTIMAVTAMAVAGVSVALA